MEAYCDLSADPVGRLVLGVLGRAGDSVLVRASDDVCTGLQLVNFLQDVPRDLELGRVYLPAEDRRRFGVERLDRPSAELTALLRFEGERAGRCWRAASSCARGSAAGWGARSGSSRAAGSRRSTPSRRPAGTCSRGARDPPAHGSPARRWQCCL